jgi:hypothetical protein
VTRALRIRHRRAVATLAVLLPVGVAAAVASRPAVISESRPGEADAGLRVAARWIAADAAATRPAAEQIEVAVTSDVAQPELLAYWMAYGPEPRGGDVGLPAHATLLGSARIGGARRFAAPDPARGTAGTVVLYSLAHGRVAAAVALPHDAGAESAGPR